MKKKVLLLVSTIIALSGCSKSNAPSFEKFNNEVSFDTFKECIVENKYSDYLKFENSCSGKVYYGVDASLQSSIGDVAILNDEGINEREITFAFDSVNNRSSFKETGESSFVSTGAEIDEQRVSKTTVSTQYQYNDKLSSFIFIDMKEKTYKKYDNKNITDSILYSIDDEYVIFQSLYKQYETAEEENKSRYGFYVDGSYLTMTYKYEDSKESIGAETSEVVQKTVTTYDYLYQLSINDGKFNFRSRCSTTTEDRYFETTALHLKDEYVKTVTTNTCSLEIGTDNPKIKEVDITSYSSLDKDPEGGLLA